jgi:hypothetical protein
MINRENRKAVVEEVRLIIVEALREGDTIRPGELAGIIAAAYPNSFRKEQIEQHIRKAATMAGVRIGAAKEAARERAADDLSASL